ncbi:MAG: VanW family protein [Brevefilum sp.]
MIKETELSKNTLMQIFLALPLSMLVFSSVLAMLLLGFEVIYAEKIYPGVYVHDVNLSGLTLDEASSLLAEEVPYTYGGQIILNYGEKTWEAHPIDFGYLVDPSFSAQQAYAFGRDGWLPGNLLEKGRAWFTGVQLSPVAFYDERMAQSYLQSIADEIDRPVLEASLALEDTEVIVKRGQVGRELDIEGTLALLRTSLSQMQNLDIELPVKEMEPSILDVGPQAELAREILSESLILTAPDGEGDTSSWSIQPEALAAMLSVTSVENGAGEATAYAINVNEGLFEVYLKRLAPELELKPINARFIFNDDTGELEVIEPAMIGRSLDVTRSVEQINAKLKEGKHRIALQFTSRPPDVTDESTGEDLGITELVHQETSYFYGSDAARIQNIEKASSEFHGLLISPGETFSMAEALGNISLENGYAEALIIYGGQTIQGVGGGVCQVSTTLFRTVFFAGFPIVERHAHAYRVGYYEMRPDGSKDPNLAGLDATVYVPIVDFKFTNDTDHWLLMETYMGNASLTWKFYSTKDGRSVSWQTTGPKNVIPAPEPLYRENPELEKGEIEQVDYEADGAEISITRTVYKNDQVHFSDSFYTKFRPWQAIYEYGPGTEDIPESEEN